MPEGTLSLSEVLQRVGNTLRKEFPSSYWIVAEILEMHVNRSGHCYLELVEKSEKSDDILARTRGTIWSSRYTMLRPYFEASTGTQLKSGIKLLFRATVAFHSLYGFSLSISDIDPDYTVGDLARKRLEVIRRLQEKGVLEMNRELPFPTVPQRIAVISSETAAGYGDFMETIENHPQGYHFHTRLFHAVMQGDDAPASIINAMDRVFELAGEFDCVALIRGGGSRADLECYNDYELAYYITQFPLPVVTGIGHERDQSVVDMVASRGLKTPTAVAEFFVDQLLSFEYRLTALHDRLAMLVKRIVKDQTAMLERYGADLVHVSKRFLHRRSEYAERAGQQLNREVRSLLSRQKEYLRMLEKRNELVNPQLVLKRGYSITLFEGRAVSGIRGIRKGAMLETRLYRGTIMSTVDKTAEKKQPVHKNGKGEDHI